MREVSEANYVLDQIVDWEIPGLPPVNLTKLGILGHSRGGGIAILAAAGRTDIEAAVTWGGVSTFERYSERQRDQWLRDGYLEVMNSRTGQVMRLGIGLLEELESQRENLDIVSAVHKCSSPLLILHGDVDVSVTVDNAEALFAAGERGRIWLHTIPKTGHTFGVGHPFTESTPALEEAIDRTISFFSGHLL
jgi:dipeptidyl aminopeptidase/acylaminoacyl peptidase